MKQKRWELERYRNWRLRHEIIFLGLIAILFFSQAQEWIFNSEPATGGDTGSHFWPLVTLVKESLPNFSIRIWNPGNLGGEPHLTHYFPFPYLVMAFFSLFVPLGQAFNLGTILPVLIYPFCFFWSFRRMGFKGLQPLLASSLSLIFLYVESFSMWGGNALSTLAGQFAHLYALGFFVLGIGEYIRGIQRDRISILAILSFAAVLLSHFYVALFIPIFVVGTLFDFRSWKKKFVIAVKTGLASLLLSAWFVIPMLDNSRWNTAFGLQWHTKNIFLEAFPVATWAVLVFFAASGLYTMMRGSRFSLYPYQKLLRDSFLFMGITAIGLYKIFPWLGLVDIRVFPILYIALVGLTTVFVDFWISDLWPRYKKNFALAVLAGFFLILAQGQIRNFPEWVKWNYGSWSSKSAYGDLQKLTRDLKGSYSDPRVIYENSELSNAAGTMRVFEMLPYFSQRSTWESVYMQSTILAPAAFYMQALISQTPSCPFPNYQCTSYEPQRILPYAQLMAVSDLILIDPDVRKKADSLSELEKKGDYGIWHWYQVRQQPSYVEVPSTQLQEVPFIEYKSRFYDWFLSYQPEQPFLWSSRRGESLQVSSIKEKSRDCHPEVSVGFNRLILRTDCENVLHILKFAFHPNFVSGQGEEIFLVSPGFMGIVPKTDSVTLEWKNPWLWNLANLISWLSFAFLLAGSWVLVQRSRSRNLFKKKFT